MRCRLKCLCKRKTLICTWLLCVAFGDTLGYRGFFDLYSATERLESRNFINCGVESRLL